MPRILARAGIVSVATLGVMFGGACDDHSSVPATEPCGNRAVISLPACPTEEGFSDEACVAFDDLTRMGRVTPEDRRAPSIAAPAENESVPGSTPYTFRWQAPTVLRRSPARRTLAMRVLRATVLPAEAWAHCPAFTGRGYDVTLRVAGQTVLRRQQSRTEWTPSAEEWQRLRAAAAGNVIELVVQTALFTNSSVNPGSGPFVQATPRRFTIAR